METVVLSIAAFLTSLLTFFSGFGLGTIMLPLFMLFFPVDIAIALTGIVHFTNNLFKITLVWRNTDRDVLIKFGLPAIAASFLGAFVLLKITVMPEIFSYSISGKVFSVTVVKLVIAFLLVFFALFEILPSAQKIQFGRDKLIAGGLLSGFFGGLSGIQGAIRSAFLIKSGLTKEAYIATGVSIACLIDISRLSVYSTRFAAIDFRENLVLLIAAVLSAMAGALLGKKLIKKITFRSVQIIVAVMLILIAIALGTGLI
jgi:uncharacterized membrane protein YfcA